MISVSAQLQLSAVGIRLAGYVVENHLRAARTFGEAAIESNPFLPRTSLMPLKSSENAVAKPQPETVKAEQAKPTPKPKLQKAAPAKIDGGEPKLVGKTTEKPAEHQSGIVEIKPAELAPSSSQPGKADTQVESAKPKSEAPAKRAREPSQPPAMPGRVSSELKSPAQGTKSTRKS